MASRFTTLAATACLLLLALGLWTAYAPGFHGPFLFDDFQNFLHNDEVRMDRLDQAQIVDALYSWPSDSRLPNRPLSRLTLALNHYGSGGRFVAYHMKVTNLAIHGLNALLLFLLARGLFAARFGVAATSTTTMPADAAARASRATWLALLVAAVWALHPVQLTAVLYVVQRMASMAATFVFLGLLAYVMGRQRLPRHPLRGTVIMLGGMGACVVTGYFCKQNVILLPFLALACEMAFFSRAGLTTASRRGLLLVFGLSVVLPVVAAAVLWPWIWEWLLSSYDIRTFGPWQRLMTEGRVLMLYLGLLALPRLESFSLYRDDIALSTGLFEPWMTAVCAGILLALLVSALFCARKRHVWAFAVLFFLAGHLLESTVVALELAFEHRNYIPSAGLFVALVYYLAKAGDRLGIRRRARVVIALSLVLALGFITHNRARVWSDDLTLARYLVRHNSGSYRAQSLLAKALAADKKPVKEIYAAYRSAAASPVDAVYPLMRMRRLIAGLLYMFEDGRTEGEASAPPPNRYDGDLVINEAYLLQLARLVELEGERRLRGTVIQTETTAELVAILKCVRANLDLCWGLREVALRWMEVALEEGQAAKATRVNLLFVSAGLHGGVRRYERALELLGQAREIAPYDENLREQKAIYLGYLGRFQEAARIMDELELEARERASRMEKLASTRALIAGMREEQEPL